MRRYGLVVTLLVAMMATGAWADVPDPAHCTVDSALINACPYDHPYGVTDAERYQDIEICLLTEGDDPVAGFPATDISFSVVDHSGYPNLGSGPTGDCDNCENHYTVTVVGGATETDANGCITYRVEVGPFCAPSMTCPVEIWVMLAGIGTIPYPIEILQNSHDLVPNGDVRGPDFGAFSTAFNNWTVFGIPTPAADFVWVLTPVPQTQWGEVTGPDFGAFSTHYTDCCGHIKEPNPANCDTWTDPCP
jgi:hypothetical protein